MTTGQPYIEVSSVCDLFAHPHKPRTNTWLFINRNGVIEHKILCGQAIKPQLYFI